MPIIVDNNKVIDTDVRTIITMLQQQLYVMGINKLNKVDYKLNNARITCPIHKNGQEHTPSCDILLHDKIRGDEEIPAGTVHCFSCGYRANIVKFVADCLDISYRAATEWLLNCCSYSLLENVRDLGNLDLISNNITNNYSELPIVTLDELKSYDYVHTYMFTRKLNDFVIDKFDVGYDPQTDSLTFPVYVNGTCLFVAKRRTKFKRFDLPEIFPKPVYGLDYITDDEIIVCESIINALTCWAYGKQAVALFGTGSDYQIDLLNKISVRKIILALDGDDAGRKGTYRLSKGLTNKIVTKLNLPDGKDINDLTKEQFYEILSQETF